MTRQVSVGEIVTAWYWANLGQDDGRTRAVRARLRRCESTVEALTIAETHDLFERLREHGRNPQPDQLALLSTVFARIKEIDGDKLAALFGKRESKDGARTLSENRFQALIRSRAPRNLLVPLRRSIAILGPNLSCNGRALGEDLFFWDDSIRNRWCFEYFGAEFAHVRKGDTAQ